MKNKHLIRNKCLKIENQVNGCYNNKINNNKKNKIKHNKMKKNQNNNKIFRSKQNNSNKNNKYNQKCQRIYQLVITIYLYKFYHNSITILKIWIEIQYKYNIHQHNLYSNNYNQLYIKIHSYQMIKLKYIFQT